MLRMNGGFDLQDRDRALPCRSFARMCVIAALLAGCATGQPPAPAGSADTSGYLGAGTRSSIVVTNTRYERAIECGGAIARLHRNDAGGDADEVEALGSAWMANAIDLGARRGLDEKQVVAAAGALGGHMSAADAATVWTGCRTGK